MLRNTAWFLVLTFCFTQVVPAGLAVTNLNTLSKETGVSASVDPLAEGAKKLTDESKLIKTPVVDSISFLLGGKGAIQEEKGTETPTLPKNKNVPSAVQAYADKLQKQLGSGFRVTVETFYPECKNGNNCRGLAPEYRILVEDNMKYKRTPTTGLKTMSFTFKAEAWCTNSIPPSCGTAYTPDPKSLQVTYYGAHGDVSVAGALLYDAAAKIFSERMKAAADQGKYDRPPQDLGIYLLGQVSAFKNVEPQSDGSVKFQDGDRSYRVSRPDPKGAIVLEELLPSAVQDYVDALKAKFRGSFSVTAERQKDGTYLVRISRANTCTASAGLDCQSTSGAPGSFGSLEFNVAGDGKLNINSIKVNFVGNAYSVDGGMLFDAARQIFAERMRENAERGMYITPPPNPNLNFLMMVTDFTKLEVRKDGAVKFTYQGNSYRAFRDAEGKVVLEAELTPEQKAIAAVKAAAQNGLINTFGFSKDTLDQLIKDGKIKITVDLEKLTATVTIDPTVTLPAGAVNWLNPLGLTTLPGRIQFQLGKRDGSIKDPTETYYLVSGGFQMRNLSYEFTFHPTLASGMGRMSLPSDGQLASLKIYNEHPDFVCVKAPCHELVESITYSYLSSKAETSVTISITYSKPQDGVASRDVVLTFSKETLSGDVVQYYIQTVTDKDAAGNVNATSRFNYRRGQPRECFAAPCPQSPLQLVGISRTDAEGNPLSEIVFNGDKALITLANGTSKEVSLITLQELLDLARQFETENYIPKAVQALVERLQHIFGDRYNVTANILMQMVLNASNNTAGGDSNNQYYINIQPKSFPAPVTPGGLVSMYVFVDKDGNFKSIDNLLYDQMTLERVQVQLLYSAAALVMWNGQPTFDQVLGALGRFTVNKVDADGAVHFSLDGKNYKAYRDAQGEPRLAEVIAVSGEILARAKDIIGAGVANGAYLVDLPLLTGSATVTKFYDANGKLMGSYTTNGSLGPINNIPTWRDASGQEVAREIFASEALLARARSVLVHSGEVAYGWTLVRMGEGFENVTKFYDAAGNLMGTYTTNPSMGPQDKPTWHDAEGHVVIETPETRATAAQVALGKEVLGLRVASGSVTVFGGIETILYYDAEGKLVGRSEDTRNTSNPDGKESWYLGEVLFSEIHRDGSERLYTIDGYGTAWIFDLQPNGTLFHFVCTNSQHPETNLDSDDWIKAHGFFPNAFGSILSDLAVSTEFVLRFISRVLNQDLLEDQRRDLRASVFSGLVNRLSAIERGSAWDACAFMIGRVLDFFVDAVQSAPDSPSMKYLETVLNGYLMTDLEMLLLRYPKTVLGEVFWEHLQHRDLIPTLEMIQNSPEVTVPIFCLKMLAQIAKTDPESRIGIWFRNLLRETIRPTVAVSGAGETLFTESDAQYQVRVQRVMALWDNLGVALIDPKGLYGVDPGLLDELVELLSVFPPEMVRNNLNCIFTWSGGIGYPLAVVVGITYPWGIGSSWTEARMQQAVAGMLRNGLFYAVHELSHTMDYYKKSELRDLYLHLYQASSEPGDYADEYGETNWKEDFATMAESILLENDILEQGIGRFDAGKPLFLEKRLLAMREFVGTVDGKTMYYNPRAERKNIPGSESAPSGPFYEYEYTTTLTPVQVDANGQITEVTIDGIRYDFVYDAAGRLVSMTHQSVAAPAPAMKEDVEPVTHEALEAVRTPILEKISAAQAAVAAEIAGYEASLALQLAAWKAAVSQLGFDIKAEKTTAEGIGSALEGFLAFAGLPEEVKSMIRAFLAKQRTFLDGLSASGEAYATYLKQGILKIEAAKSDAQAYLAAIEARKASVIGATKPEVLALLGVLPKRSVTSVPEAPVVDNPLNALIDLVREGNLLYQYAPFYYVPVAEDQAIPGRTTAAMAIVAPLARSFAPASEPAKESEEAKSSSASAYYSPISFSSLEGEAGTLVPATNAPEASALGSAGVSGLVATDATLSAAVSGTTRNSAIFSFEKGSLLFGDAITEAI